MKKKVIAIVAGSVAFVILVGLIVCVGLFAKIRHDFSTITYADFAKMNVKTEELLLDISSKNYDKFNVEFDKYYSKFFSYGNCNYGKLSLIWLNYLKDDEYKNKITDDGYKHLIDAFNKKCDSLDSTTKNDIDRFIKPSVCNIIKSYIYLAQNGKKEIPEYDKIEKFFVDVLKAEHKKTDESNGLQYINAVRISAFHAQWTFAFSYYSDDLFKDHFKKYYETNTIGEEYISSMAIAIKRYETDFPKEQNAIILNTLKDYYKEFHKQEFPQKLIHCNQNLMRQRCIYMALKDDANLKIVEEEDTKLTAEFDEYVRVKYDREE